MKILVAFDKFKDSIGAPEACDEAVSVVRERFPSATVTSLPLTDGGEGFAEILTRRAGGELRDFSASGPRGASTDASVGFVRGSALPPATAERLELSMDSTVALVEMAQVAGLASVPSGERDLWITTTFGVGQLMLNAREAGADAFLLGVGGSATHDLGLGALAALGLGPFPGPSDEGDPLGRMVPASWDRLRGFTGGPPQPFPPVKIACDVSNPLLGRQGAAAVYGPQKGLKQTDLARIEAATEKTARLLLRHFKKPESLLFYPGTGAAGGIAFGLLTALDAELVPGAGLVAEWQGLEQELEGTDIVITGEGRFDDSSLAGKGPGALVRRALELEKRVFVFAGAMALSDDLDSVINNPLLSMHAISPDHLSLEDALRQAPVLLRHSIRNAFLDFFPEGGGREPL